MQFILALLLQRSYYFANNLDYLLLPEELVQVFRHSLNIAEYTVHIA